MCNGGSRRAKKVAKKLKKVQDALGCQHDPVTALNWLRTMAELRTFPAATLFGAGALYQVIRRRSCKALRVCWKVSEALRTGDMLDDVLRALGRRGLPGNHLGAQKT